jgi:hypothetical protein
MTYKIMIHQQNQHGWAVSLTKYEGALLVGGFVLITYPTQAEQTKYAQDLHTMTGWVLEEGF